MTLSPRCFTPPRTPITAASTAFTFLPSYRLAKPLLTALAAAALVACGGGGDSVTPTAAPAAAAAAGTYSLTTVCTGDVLVEVAGGNYLDEASNTTTPLSTPLRVMVATNGGTVTGVATPLTTMPAAALFAPQRPHQAPRPPPSTRKASRIATQFGLGNVNLATALPVVTGTPDAYGNALRTVFQYLRNTPQTTLATVTNSSFTNKAGFTAFSTGHNTAFRTINDITASVSFEGNTFNFTGTGVGGGSGTCGVKIAGSVTTAGFTVPVSFDFCNTGLQAGSCDAGNSALNQSVASQDGLGGAANLTYTYSATRASGDSDGEFAVSAEGARFTKPPQLDVFFYAPAVQRVDSQNGMRLPTNRLKTLWYL